MAIREGLPDNLEIENRPAHRPASW